MKPHKPNFIPARTRAALVVAAIFLLIYMGAGLATGYTYLPSKRGGILLSGVPTLLFVLCASSFFLAALLTIIDHYDQRANEATYAATRSLCLKAGVFLLVAAPFGEFGIRVLHRFGIEVPLFHGLAENYTFYSPGLSRFTPYVDSFLNVALVIGLLSFAAGGVGLLIDKYSSGLKRVAIALMALAMLGVSTLFLVYSTRDFLAGEVSAGRRSDKHVVRAQEDPAKFNAILLTRFALGGVLFTASAFLLALPLTARGKTLLLTQSRRTKRDARHVPPP